MIKKYEETAGKIQSLLHEPAFAIFYETPIYELTKTQREMRHNVLMTMSNAPEGEPLDSEAELEKTPWPDVEFLFGEDESYQDIVASIMKCVTYSIDSVTAYAEVSFLYIFPWFCSNNEFKINR